VRDADVPGGAGAPALMVFTRDLRVTDNPALTAAFASGTLRCAFVHDTVLRHACRNAPRRLQFLAECLADLDGSLRLLGSRLEERAGSWVEEVLRLVAETGARTVHLSEDVTPYAQRRTARLRAALGRSAELVTHPGVTVVPPGALRPSGNDHYRVFSPYYRRWVATPRRAVMPAPRGAAAPDGPAAPARRAAARPPASPGSRGGEQAATARLLEWSEQGISRYGGHRDDLRGPATSRLSADLHFGCLSPLAVERAVAARPGADPFLRQLCWRDFYLQIAARSPRSVWAPGAATPPGTSARTRAVLQAWRDGTTGVPIVDAAMRQLAEEGFLVNRTRMIVASFLTRTLGLDWREGAAHFLDRLVDADVTLNNLNWQWTAGLGTGGNPWRVLDPTRQARRFDPQGCYVRRYVPELRSLAPVEVHEPWRLGRRGLRGLGYPAPVVPVGATVGRTGAP